MRPVSDQRMFLASGTTDARIAIIDLAISEGTLDPLRTSKSVNIDRSFFVRFSNHGTSALSIQLRESALFSSGFTLITGTVLSIPAGGTNELNFNTALRFLEIFGSGNAQFSMNLQGAGELHYAYGN